MAENWIHRQLIQLQHFSKYAYTIPYHLKKSGFKYNGQNTIAVFTQPRGGSTWFTNLLSAMPKTAKIDGPIYQGPLIPDGRMPEGNVSKLKSLRKLGLHYHQFIPVTAKWSEAHSFFHQLFSQQFYTPYLFQETPLHKLYAAEKFVFKFYHASLMMPWLIENFDIKPIFLIRSPYAVVASQLKYCAFRETIETGCYRMPKFRFSEFFDQYESILEEVTSPVEILTARWCLNNLPLISSLDNNEKWLTVSYESVVMHKDWELNRIFQYIGESIPDSIDMVYNRPSMSTSKSSDVYEEKIGHLSNWKSVLTNQEVEQIDRILERFEGIGYSQALEPDYATIYHGKEIPPRL